MSKSSNFYLTSLAAAILFLTILPVLAKTRSEPAPLYGSYTRDLDRSKQTFNGKLNPNSRPQKQIELFSTVCEASGCIARTPNLYAPPGAPKFIEYHWANDRWELKADHFFNCNDGSRVKSVLFEFMKSNGEGSFAGERSIQIDGSGCPGEGPGTYRIPFKLIPS